MSEPKIPYMVDADSKPFSKKHKDQIKLVSEFHELNMETSTDLVVEISDILSKNSYFDDARKAFIMKNVERRLELLQGMILNKQQSLKQEISPKMNF